MPQTKRELTFGTMRVGPVDIQPEALAAAYVAMKRRASFSFADALTDMIAAGVDEKTAYRATDRLLQRLRGLGLLYAKGRRWNWLA